MAMVGVSAIITLLIELATERSVSSSWKQELELELELEQRSRGAEEQK